MTATLEQARTAAATADRKQEILDAVDEMLRVHDAWEADPKAPDVPSAALEQAVLYAIEICTHGDIPSQCRELCMTAMPRLREDWEQYAEGDARRPDGSPTARFWASFKAVVMARKGAVPFVPKRPEPVSELIRQGVTYEQIARHIYGYRGEGLFLRDDESINVQAILDEKEKPGSVIPADWVHPAELERQREFERQVDHRLAAATTREHDQTETTADRMSIEDFLLQGAAPQLIAKAKMIDLADVLAVQSRLQNAGKIAADGTPNEGPDPKLDKGDESDTLDLETLGDEDDSEDFDPVDFIAERVAANQGVPEIVAGLKEHGMKFTAKEVQKVIADLPEKAAT